MSLEEAVKRMGHPNYRHIQALRFMIKKNEFAAKEVAGMKWLPSEKAMTIANLHEEKQALEAAISALEKDHEIPATG